MRYITGPAVDEIFFEHGLHVARVAAGYQETCKMRAADKFGIRGIRASALQAAGNPSLFEAACHALGPLAAPAANLLETGDELAAPGVDIQADDVQRMAVPGHRYFHAVDQPNALEAGGGPRFAQASDVVVIGQRQHGDPPCLLYT